MSVNHRKQIIIPIHCIILYKIQNSVTVTALEEIDFNSFTSGIYTTYKTFNHKTISETQLKPQK